MKKLPLIILTIIVLISSSCKNPKISELENRVSKLEKLNSKLSDSLNKIEYKKLISTQLIGIPVNNKFITNQPNVFHFYLQSIQEFPKYDVYRIYPNQKKERELIYENYTESVFEYNFYSKNEEVKSLDLLAVFNLDSIMLNIPAKIKLK